ncbi:oxidoreductase [Jeotgalicoccus coquinae]|uniref:Gluconate 2-dehydrogenase gamma chain n=1 Tax=Jeotgalicoccus coquinae TaxID=709509 RepID=A0A6V7R7P0_9STAP|nr:gluconate 2-dehydrogenase subunit 3 family protein [Jeotgalicoccus coquinae]MBB6423027.1 gluconate 2-dehydrogenase gamma chain [Jeotgalicoccus coquinae]GGE11277.1 oxidoreductase [Jeotgalicoccus coquinae]CAD2073507.1 Gluconate 2-dehydrogenase subunit 3 precursor [Jeotgalicoccus coquinae]
MADEKQFSRRDFLKTTGAATGGVIGGSLLGGLIGFNMNEVDNGGGNESADSDSSGGSHGHSDHGGGIPDQGRVFFSNDEDFRIIEAAMERIFPESDAGPGAKELGAAYFLDGQLAGAYGHNSREYMQGPFHEGKGTQGYQSNLNRASYFMLGIRKLQEEAEERHDTSFAKLDGKQQDEILKAFETDEVDFNVPKNTATAGFFFKLLHTATLEGVYSDPIYRGNRNMAGWKMKQFPGHQHSYLDVIDTDEFQDIEPIPNFG